MTRLWLARFFAWYATKLMTIAIALAESVKRSAARKMVREQTKVMALFNLIHQAESGSSDPTESDKADPAEGPAEGLCWPPDPTSN